LLSSSHTWVMPSFSPTIAFFAMVALSFGVVRRVAPPQVLVDPMRMSRSRERSAQADLAERRLGCAVRFRIERADPAYPDVD
jgi:hypothetical protein